VEDFERSPSPPRPQPHPHCLTHARVRPGPDSAALSALGLALDPAMPPGAGDLPPTGVLVTRALGHYRYVMKRLNSLTSGRGIIPTKLTSEESAEYPPYAPIFQHVSRAIVPFPGAVEIRPKWPRNPREMTEKPHPPGDGRGRFRLTFA